MTTPADHDLRTAAQAVVDRWDTPLWKDAPATAEYIGRLRAALASAPAQPVAEPAPSATAHVGDSLFESWFSEHNPAHRGTKQQMRDAYAAGMGNPKAQPSPTPQASHGQTPSHVLHLVQDAFAEVAMAFPKAFAMHKVGIADTAVREALAAPAGATEPTEQQILGAAFAPAQPAVEASRFGSPELQAMLIARCVEKDQVDSVPAVEREQERIAFKDAHRHLELDEVPDAWGRPMFKHPHIEASWLGWIARASYGQALTPAIGGLYNWKGQPERLVYMGARRYPGDSRPWHQFAKVEKPEVCWLEVLTSELAMFEETKGS